MTFEHALLILGSDLKRAQADVARAEQRVIRTPGLDAKNELLELRGHARGLKWAITRLEEARSGEQFRFERSHQG